MIRQTFKKAEKLTNKKIFELLFTKGQSFAVFPFRFVWVRTSAPLLYPVQVGISVPKKLFTNAVDRNKIKRRIRESYRKNKSSLYEFLLLGGKKPQEKNLPVALMIIYIAKEVLPYQEIEKKMIVSLQKVLTLVK